MQIAIFNGRANVFNFVQLNKGKSDVLQTDITLRGLTSAQLGAVQALVAQFEFDANVPATQFYREDDVRRTAEEIAAVGAGNGVGGGGNGIAGFFAHNGGPVGNGGTGAVGQTEEDNDPPFAQSGETASPQTSTAASASTAPAAASTPSPAAPRASTVTLPTELQADIANVKMGTLRDKDGVPHHAKLHTPTTSKTGGKMQDGTWKNMKGGNKEHAAAWRAYWLEQQQPAQQQQPAATPQPAAQQPAAQQPAAQQPAAQQPAAQQPAAQQPAAQQPVGDPFSAAAFFSGQVMTVEQQLEQAPPVEAAPFLALATELGQSGMLTQSIAIEIMRHPMIAAKDNLDLGRDPEKRRKGFMLLQMLKAGTYKQAA